MLGDDLLMLSLQLDVSLCIKYMCTYPIYRVVYVWVKYLYLKQPVHKKSDDKVHKKGMKAKVFNFSHDVSTINAIITFFFKINY